ncbi:carbohydrate ABC transporter permease [Natronoglycomyces albus]|uniref:Carbohydrate ABC transporter permease n=2 Tax=Natronoglycomyces albus TaxID=2811108 RepID=A0A895XTR7_9ACTN|nr:carbohydrate ABC transporter permease [Natronoglycomyces albus]
MVIVPVVWIVISSFKTPREIATDPLGLPAVPQIQNYLNAWTNGNIGQYFLNTFQVMAFSITGTMLLGAMVAYVIARYEFPGNRLLYFFFAGGMMFPVFLALFPLFKTLENVGLLNTKTGLALVYIAYSLPFTVFFLTAFFRTLPHSIAEAAMIDGAGHYRLFFQVMLPMARPGLVAITIFNIIGQWNQFLLPLVLMSRNPDDAMISQGLANLAMRQGYEGDPGALFAGTVLAMIPVFIAYVIFQRQIQAGLTAGAVK